MKEALNQKVQEKKPLLKNAKKTCVWKELGKQVFGSDPQCPCIIMITGSGLLQLTKPQQPARRQNLGKKCKQTFRISTNLFSSKILAAHKTSTPVRTAHNYQH